MSLIAFRTFASLILILTTILKNTESYSVPEISHPEIGCPELIPSNVLTGSIPLYSEATKWATVDNHNDCLFFTTGSCGGYRATFTNIVNHATERAVAILDAQFSTASPSRRLDMTGMDMFTIANAVTNTVLAGVNLGRSSNSKAASSFSDPFQSMIFGSAKQIESRIYINHNAPNYPAMFVGMIRDLSGLTPKVKPVIRPNGVLAYIIYLPTLLGDLVLFDESPERLYPADNKVVCNPFICMSDSNKMPSCTMRHAVFETWRYSQSGNQKDNLYKLMIMSMTDTIVSKVEETIKKFPTGAEA